MDNKELTEYDESTVPTDLPEGMPMEVWRVIQQSFSLKGITGPQESSITKKMNEQHITQLLDNEKTGMELEAKDRERNREYEDKEKTRKFWLTIIIAVVSVLVLGFVVLIFKDKPDILIPVLSLLFGGGLGFGGGYGIGKTKRDS